MGVDLSDFSFDIEESGNAEALEFDAEPSVDEAVAEGSEDETVFFLDGADEALDAVGGSDEVATKLDLARAYIDMGDGEGAKDILGEVLLEGNDAQKAEAEELMQKV